MRRFIFLCVWLVTLPLAFCGDRFTCKHDRYLRFHSGLSNTAVDYASSMSLRKISILYDTQFLSETDYTCITAGDVVFVGMNRSILSPDEAPNYPSCTSSVTVDCWLTCTSRDLITTEFRNQLTSAAAYVSTFISSMIQVTPAKNSLNLPPGVYGTLQGVNITSSYASKWKSSPDYVVFLTARPTTEEGSLSYGAGCIVDQNGRTVAGHINIDPGKWKETDDPSSALKTILLHETIHAMGFSVLNLPQYGISGSPSYSKIGNGANSFISWSTSDMIDYVKNQFQCSTIQSVSWENTQDAQSHWEQFFHDGDLMSTVYSTSATLSKLTLLFFQGSNWYKVNDIPLPTNSFGYGLGCSFYNNCRSRTQRGYFCERNQTLSCTYDYYAKGKCNIVEYANPLPVSYQYFTNPRLGGNSAYGNYCPMYEPIEDCTRLATLNPSAAEESTPNSSCFMSNIRPKTASTLKDMAPICYHTLCISPDTLKVRIGAHWYTCKSDGPTTIFPSDFVGSVECPGDIPTFCLNRFRGVVIPVKP